MTATMLSAAVHAPDDVRLDRVPVPRPGPGDVVVRIKACGICGSDLGYARAGGLPIGSHGPLPLGHEFSGVIAAVGAGISGFAPGERVVVNPTTPANMIGSGGPGGFAPYILIRDAMAPDTLHRIPDGLDDSTAALTEPFAVALHGVNRSGAQPGDKVVVFGAGPIGLGVVAMLRQRGVSDVIVVDRVEARLDRALAMGAAHALNPERCDLWREIGALHGAGELYGMPVVHTDRFIDVAGAAPVIAGIIAHARFGAHLTVVAVHHAPVPTDFAMLLGKEMSLVTAMAYPTEFAAVLDLLAAGAVPTGPYVSHTYPFDQFEAAFAMAADPAAAAKVIVKFP